MSKEKEPMRVKQICKLLTNLESKSFRFDTPKEELKGIEVPIKDYFSNQVKEDTTILGGFVKIDEFFNKVIKRLDEKIIKDLNMNNLNLQVALPYYEPCIYKCPFCVARNHKHNNRFFINEKQFLEAFSVLGKEHKDIVITGQNDPTQQKELVDKIIKIAKEQSICSKIELQTKDIDYYIDDILMCYSLSTHREFNKLKDKGYKKYRAVFIVSDKLKFDNLDLSNVYQATFKQMQYSEDEKTNEYITKHRLSNVEIVLEVEKLKSKFPNCSIRYDLDCQKADSRYHILRSDGVLYSNWEAFDPIQIIFSKDILGTSYWLEKDYIDKLIEDLFD